MQTARDPFSTNAPGALFLIFLIGGNRRAFAAANNPFILEPLLYALA